MGGLLEGNIMENFDSIPHIHHILYVLVQLWAKKLSKYKQNLGPVDGYKRENIRHMFDYQLDRNFVPSIL